MQVDVGRTGQFKVLKQNGHLHASGQHNRGGIIVAGSRKPLVDDQVAIDPQANTVIGGQMEGMGFIVLSFDVARPADLEAIGIHQDVG